MLVRLEPAAERRAERAPWSRLAGSLPGPSASRGSSHPAVTSLRCGRCKGSAKQPLPQSWYALHDQALAGKPTLLVQKQHLATLLHPARLFQLCRQAAAALRRVQAAP